MRLGAFWKVKLDHPDRALRQKINWAYQTVSAIAHSLKHDNPTSLRGTRTRLLILYRIWQSCVLSHATQNLQNLPTPTQAQQVQSALISFLQRTPAALLHGIAEHHPQAWNPTIHPAAGRTITFSPLQVHRHAYPSHLYTSIHIEMPTRSYQYPPQALPRKQN